MLHMRKSPGGYAFSSPEPVVSWSRGRETRGSAGSATGRLQIKPSGSGDENGGYAIYHRNAVEYQYTIYGEPLQAVDLKRKRASLSCFS